MKNSVRLSVALALVLGTVASTRAQDGVPPDTLPLVRVPPIIVTATRGATPPDRVGSSVTVISRDEIELHQYRTVAEALRGVPGLAVARNGGPGGTTSVFVRGAASDKVMVRIDGVEVNDPSSPSDGFDFAHMTTDDVERIEVLRGPQGPLYGSRAMAGVVEIFTRRGNGPPTLSGSVETGELGTLRVTGSARGGTATASWALTAARDETDGISATTSLTGPAEDDEDRRTTLSGRASWRPVDRLEGGVALRRLTAESGIDQSGPGGDDPNFVSETDRTTGRAFLAAGGSGDPWDAEVSIGFTTYDRLTRDRPDEARPASRSDGRFEGTRRTVEARVSAELADRWRVSGGVDHEREEARTSFVSDGEFGPFESVFPERDARTTGAWGQLEAGAGPFHVAAGARTDDHDRFGTATTWRVAPVWEISSTGTRLRGSVGTGFKAPTLFQLFDPEFGDAGLDPEESDGWDVGVEQSLAGESIRLSATWFDTAFERLVGFAFPDGFSNIEAADARGLELTAEAAIGPDLAVRGAYTYTDTENLDPGAEDLGEPLIRRPRHRFDLDVEGRPHERVRLALGVRRVGERDDLDFTAFPAERVTLDGYTLVRISGDVSITPRLAAFARVENLLDESYTEVLGFETPGRAGYVGVRLRAAR